jgi:uncharacterized protein (DUF885 family)
MPSSHRTPTAVDAVAEAWVDTVVELDPVTATYIGRGGDDRFGDYSPAGARAFADAARAALSAIEKTDPVDEEDHVTRADLIRDLRLQVELADAQWHLRDLNVIASPVQDIRSVFDLMPTSSIEDWATIERRLAGVPGAIVGYIESLRAGISAGVVPARRQAVEVVAQIARYTGDQGFFATFVGDARPDEGDLPASLARDLADRAGAARVAYADLSRFLATELAPAAAGEDAVGRDLYALHSRRFLGAVVDLDETYEWGLAELARMTAEQGQVADRILPGSTVAEAIAFLDSDPAHVLHGTAALQEWMQGVSDEAIEQLGASHFDIPEPVRRLECRIAPTQEGGIYYTGPTDDFSRPGRMWWSVPPGVDQFATWRERTTVYHEGVPGHHLQIGQAVYLRDRLNSWRRLLAGTSGHAEGWALYAERLMADLGYLEDPGDRLGMLDGQRMRAARVVLDIGVHLGKRTPDGTGIWDHAYALDFMRHNVNMSDAFIQFEVNRYLGWPGQAPSYKIGQRIWEEIRDSTRRAEGDAFSLRRFHTRALSLGGVGLDTLRAALQDIPSRLPRDSDERTVS